LSGKIISAKVVPKPQNTRKPWCCRSWDESGKQAERSFRTQREAADYKDKLLTEAAAPQTTVTFADAFADWIESVKVRNSTRERLRSVYHAHRDQAIGGRKLASVASDPDGIERLVNCQRGKEMLRIVRGVCDRYIRNGKLRPDSYRLTGLQHGTVRSRPRDLIPATRGQLQTIATAVRDRDSLAVWIMHATGMRVSECLALRADDFAADTVLVAHQPDGAASV
jgi:integrase